MSTRNYSVEFFNRTTNWLANKNIALIFVIALFTSSLNGQFILCPGDLNTDITVEAPPGDCEAFVDLTILTNPSSCFFNGPALVTNSYNGNGANASDTYPVGTTTVVFTLFCNGLVDVVCDVDIVVQDVTAPDCQAQDVTIYLDEAGEVDLTPAEVDNSSEDDCDDPSNPEILCFSEFETADIGPFSGTLEDTDIFFDYTDLGIPTEHCYESSMFGCCELVAGLHYYDEQMFTVTETGIYRFSLTDEAGDTDFAGAIYSQPLNPFNLCENFVSGDDNMLAVLDPEITLVLEMTPGTYYLTTFAWTNNAGTTLPRNYTWDIVSAECEQSYICADVGDQSITLFTTDMSGNISSCDATVTVLDTIAPICAVVEDIVIQLEPLQCDTMHEFDLSMIAPATDNCDPDPMELFIPGEAMSGDPFPIGRTTVVYEIVDQYQNSDSCSFDIVVLEYIPDGLACHETINLSLDPETCTGSITQEMVLLGTDYGCLDSCTIELKDHLGNVVPNMLTYDNVGYPLTYTVCCGDVCCWGEVNVEYKAEPIIECDQNDIFICCALVDQLPPPPHAQLCVETHTEIINEVETYFECEDYIKEIVRTYQVVTKDGIRSNECTQTILIERVDIFEDIIWPDNFTKPDNPLGCPSEYDPSITGVPVVAKQIATRAILTEDLYPNNVVGHCNLHTTFKDTELFSSNPCVTKIMRLWRVTEWWCNGDEYVEWPQFIEIVDDEAPHLYAPDDMTVSISNNDCEARVELPAIDAYDECNPDEIEVDIAYPGGFADNQNGATVYLPPGLNRITYLAYDACYNADSVHMYVTVEDLRSPVAICDAVPQVALNSNGYAAIYAETMDGGSFDECGPVYITIAKMDSTCYEDDLIFNDHVQFCCEDEGFVLVRMRVTDWAGNVSECMSQVEVVNKLVPNLIAPPDTTVECTTTFDVNNLGVQFGYATTFDTCNDDVDESVEVALECNIGKIVRTFTTSNGFGSSQSAEQTIYFVNSNPFDGYKDIIWPNDVHDLYDICLEGDSKLAVPPTLTGEPIILKDNCDLIGVECKDSIFRVDGYLNACFKIKRTWKVIDWCQRINGQYPVWDSVQYIEVRDTVKPELITDLPQGDTIYYKNCDNSLIEIPAFGSSNCDELVNWEYEILDYYDNLLDYGFGTQSQNDSFYIQSILDEGHYKVILYLRDGCGNFDSKNGDFHVINKKAPVVYAKHLTITPIENNNGFKEATIWVSDVDNGSYHPCDFDFELSFSSSDINDKSRIFICDDNDGINIVSLWATDQNGNQNHVDVEITVECVEDDGLADVSGDLRTSAGEGISDVRVYLHGSELGYEITDDLGEYAFNDMPYGGNYAVEPYKNDDVLNGVSTLDLVMIQKHVLGVQALGDPNKLIAADINDSHDVSAIDLIELRKLILGIYTDFPGNTSWRFIDDTHVFIDNTDPWLEAIPEAYSINQLAGDMHVPFTGVKTGDVNGTAVGNWDGSPIVSNRSSETTFVLERLDQETIVLRSEAVEAVEGFQFVFSYLGDMTDIISLQTESIEIDDNNYHLNNDNNTLSVSWIAQEQIDINGNLFTITVAEGFDLDKIKLDNSRLNAEVYTSAGTDNLSISVDNRSLDYDFELMQMYPNPWSTQLVFDLGLSKAESIKLIITDVSGRVVYDQTHELGDGNQSIQINDDDISQAGIYYCRFVGENQQVQKKVIKMK